jgi:Xaa-Pro aminopeptidase
MIVLISGLFNLRGSDIAFNPVFFAYAIVSADHVYLYVATYWGN